MMVDNTDQAPMIAYDSQSPNDVVQALCWIMVQNLRGWKLADILAEVDRGIREADSYIRRHPLNCLPATRFTDTTMRHVRSSLLYSLRETNSGRQKNRRRSLPDSIPLLYDKEEDVPMAHNKDYSSFTVNSETKGASIVLGRSDDLGEPC